MSRRMERAPEADVVATKPPMSPDEAKARRFAERQPDPPAEIGGPQGPEPTRYGDWERNGRCIDF